MLFYELACHPEVFTKKYLLENDTAIKQIFKNITEKGSVANLNDGKWGKIIYEKLADLNEDEKKEYKLKIQLEKILKTLNTRKKIIYHKKIIDETDWLKIIYSDKDDFSVILNTLTTVDTYEAEDLLDSELWKNIIRTSSEYATQNEEYIKSEIKPILHNAQQIDLIDPYFDITKEQYKKSFKIIFDLLSKKNVNRKTSLSIHIKNQHNNQEDVIDRTNYLERWQDFFKIYNNPNIKCILYVWREAHNDKMHDRYIIRDESFCAVLPSGIDERKKNKTVWSDIGYHNIDSILNDFRLESSPFQLVAKVTVDDISVIKKGVLQSKNKIHNTIVEENIKTPGGLKISKRIRQASV